MSNHFSAANLKHPGDDAQVIQPLRDIVLPSCCSVHR